MSFLKRFFEGAEGGILPPVGDGNVAISIYPTNHLSICWIATVVAYDSVKDALEGCQIIDALSDYAFYKEGVIHRPIPANDSVQTFIDHGVENLWTYYCCGQGVDVSNRFYGNAFLP